VSFMSFLFAMREGLLCIVTAFFFCEVRMFSVSTTLFCMCVRLQEKQCGEGTIAAMLGHLWFLRSGVPARGVHYSVVGKHLLYSETCILLLLRQKI
jgi:hypothetical protein